MAGHTQRQWEGKFFRAGMRCYYCLNPLMLHEATKDHLTPITRGGKDTIDNIVPACIACNQRKGVMTETEFRAAFSKAFEIVTASTTPEVGNPLEARDEPSWERLRKEVEPGSWAWKHPA